MNNSDTVSIRAVFTVEANKEAHRIIYDKKNLLNQSGSALRTLGKEAILATYCLTRDPIE